MDVVMSSWLFDLLYMEGVVRGNKTKASYLEVYLCADDTKWKLNIILFQMTRP